MTLENIISEKIPHIQHSFTNEDKQNYGKDWINFYEPNPSVILFPKTNEEVQEIVQLANKYKIGIVPSGGRTGLSGGATATNGEMIVSLEKMNQILDFDPINQTVTVQAGVVTEALQHFAESKGLFYPVDFASKGTSQIGGNIATNAGGVKVVKYGLTRDQVLGLEFITGNGQKINTNNGLIKNATGYDLRHLIIGSEGTLGVITEAIIQLKRKPKNLNVIFFGINDIKSAIQILSLFKKQIDVTAFEFLSHNGLIYSTNQSKYPLPFSEKSPFYLLIEFENQESAGKKVEQIVMNLYKSGLIENDIYANEIEKIQQVWSYREGISESITPFIPYKNDVSVVPSQVPAFLNEAQTLIHSKYPDFEVVWYGHIADGNIHINILKPKNLGIDDFHQQCDDISVFLFELVKKYQGSISAEHGVGLLKRKFLNYSRSEAEISLMKGIKKVFDPNGIMNSGKLFA